MTNSTLEFKVILTAAFIVTAI